MSAYSNKRSDKYGGSLLNRLRFPLEIISNIKSKVGEDFPIIFRISGDEHVPGGRNIEDTKATAQILEPAGIHAIHITAGVYASTEAIIPPAAVPHAWIANDAEAVRKVVSIPVITVGRITDPLIAEAVVASGKADLVAMGRSSLADPELPNKAAEGRLMRLIIALAVYKDVSAIYSLESRLLVS
jgi:2,4-dienoyl-CoA reductase-like NADH-dependent reductase (Old Yellow Enzyme family)